MSANRTGHSRRRFLKRGALFVPAIFIPRLIRAQTVLTAPGLASFGTNAPAGGGGGGGGGGYTLLAHTSAGSSPTTGINTTGATLITVALHYFNSLGASPLTDNKSNTYTGLTAVGNSGAYFTKIFYCVNPTVGSGHTFSTTANFPVIQVLAFSGNAATPFDAQSGNNNGSPGSITPAQSAELFVTGVTGDGGPTYIINSSFISPPPDGTVQTGGNLYGAFTYKIKTDATAENPTWTTGAGSISSSAMATFK